MEPVESTKVEIRYLPGDLEHAHRVYEATKPMLWIGGAVAIWLIAVGFLTFFVTGASAAYSLLNGQLHLPISVFTLGYAIFPILLALVIWFEPLGALLRYLNYRRNAGIYAAHVEMEFDEAGVSMVREASREVYEWRLFSEAIEGSREFLLVVERRTAFLVILKKALPEAMQAAFRATLARKIARLRIVRRSPPLFLS